MRSENSESIRIYDLELATPILTQWSEDDPRVPGIDFATGWDKYHEMRLACLCAPLFEECMAAACRDNAGSHLRNLGAFFALTENILTAQRPLDMADVLVSFNGLKFDNNVLRAQGLHIADSYCYDILAEWQRVTGKRVKLDDLAKANGFVGKSGSGALAPEKWQAGRHLEVVDYCFDDCLITALIYQKIQGGIALINPYNGQAVTLPKTARAAGQEGLF